MKKFFVTVLFVLPFKVYAVLPEINFVQRNQVFMEGESATVTVELSAPTVEGVSVKLFALSTSTASMSDTGFDTSNTVIYISPGQTKGSVTFDVFDDSEVEGNELLHLRMAAPLNARVGFEDSTWITLVDRIENETVLPKVNFITNSSATSEGQVIEVIASLSAPSDSPVNVPITVCGTAEYPSDHDLYTNEITFHPGSTESVLSITINQDEVQEGIEDIIIKMTSPVMNAELGPNNTHTVTIEDTVIEVPLSQELF